MKMRRYLIYLAAMSLLVSACATNKTPVPTGGSRADGIIELSYELRMFEKPVVDWNSANATASQRCKAWGYERAEVFGGQKSKCSRYNGYGDCVRELVTVNYQCIGGQ